MHEIPPLPERPDPLTDIQTKELLEQATRQSMRTLWWLIAIQTLVIVGLVAAVVYLLVSNANATRNTQVAIQQAIQQDDGKWCATVDLLTSHPVTKPTDPSSNQSRAASYALYQDFMTLKEEFHCT